MPSADQVPVKSPHSTMQWHIWVVLTAGSTGSALRAVRPPNLHVWTAPSWQGKSSRYVAGRCSHVFGLFGAVHMTAGHNALRGSGPGQKPAFDNALAQVGCPDRRIDRLCIACCSPPNLHIVPDIQRDLVTPLVRRVPYSARPWSSSPIPSGQSCWRARWQRPWWADAPTRR